MPYCFAHCPPLGPGVTPLRILRIGNQEEDFFVIRDILARSQSEGRAELDHAGTLDEAKAMELQGHSGLVLFAHETRDGAANKLLSEFLQDGRAE